MDSPPKEFKNFEELVKKLLAVPKKEVDVKKAEYERKRKTKKIRA